MVVPYQAHRRSIADLAHDFNARASLADTEAIARKDLTIAFRVEFSETLGELEFASVDRQGPICALLSLDCILRQAIRIAGAMAGKRTAGRYVGAATNLYSMLGEQKLRDHLPKVIYPLT